MIKYGMERNNAGRTTAAQRFSSTAAYMRRIADFSEAGKIMRYLVLCRLGVTKHIAAPRLGARAAATSYNPVRCVKCLGGWRNQINTI